MNEKQFQTFKKVLEAESEMRFKKVIDKQRETTDPKFIAMLENSDYFKSFFFEAFIEGIDFKVDTKLAL